MTTPPSTLTFASPDEALEVKELKEELSQALKMLTERQQRVLTLRFGLDGYTPLSLKEIGLMFGVTMERIRQIEAKAMRKMRFRSRLRNYGPTLWEML